MDAVRVLLAAGADVNGLTGSSWSPLLIAIQNRYYRLAMFLLENGRRSEPRQQPGVDAALHRGGQPQHRARRISVAQGGHGPSGCDQGACSTVARTSTRADKHNTWTRTAFTDQWLFEDGATAFLRAAQSSDLVVMKLLLARGADPKIPTTLNVTALMVASGIGWVEGITQEWSESDNVGDGEMAARTRPRPERRGRRWPNRPARRRTQRT